MIMDQATEISHNARKYTRLIRKDIKISFIKTNYIGLKKTINCELLDISSSGAQLASIQKIAVNSQLNISIHFDSGDTFKLKAKVIWQKKSTLYKSKHSFSPINKVLKQKNRSLKTLHFYEEDERIFSKFRHLGSTQVEILTSSPVKQYKPHHLVFSLSDNSNHKVTTKILSHKQKKHHSFGVLFEKTNHDLGDCLLETQTHLIFK